MISAENRLSCVIVLPEGYSVVERYAAEQLRYYLRRIAGEPVPIKAEGWFRCSAEKRIFIGRTEALQNAGFNRLLDAAKEDSFLIKTHRGDLYLAGTVSKNSQSGTLYAVYGFLEKYLGVKFFAHDEELIPKRDRISWTEIDEFSSPSFTGRDLLSRAMRLYGDFSVKLRVKHKYAHLTEQHGGGVHPLWADDTAHNFYSLIPPAVYEDAHPDWFDRENNGLCFCNDALDDQIAEELKRRIARTPDSTFYAVMQNDTLKPCQCKRCRASNEKYLASGTLIRFVNRIARRVNRWVEKKFPTRKVSFVTFGYYFSYQPPVVKTEKGFEPIDETVIPDPSVFVYLTTIDYCFYHNLEDQNCVWNCNFTDAVSGWKRLTGNLMMWNYAANFSHYLYPFFNFRSLGANFKYFRNNGIEYLLDQGACETPYTDMQEMRTYITAKLMWNADEDVKALCEEFIDGYYQNAGKNIREYLRLLDEHFNQLDEKVGWHIRLYHLPRSMFSVEHFPIEFINKLISCLQRALESVKGIENDLRKERLKERIGKIMATPRYLLLMNYDEYFPAGKEAYARQFVADCLEDGIEQYREEWPGSASISKLYELALKNKILDY